MTREELSVRRTLCKRFLRAKAKGSSRTEDINPSNIRRTSLSSKVLKNSRPVNRISGEQVANLYAIYDNLCAKDVDIDKNSNIRRKVLEIEIDILQHGGIYDLLESWCLEFEYELKASKISTGIGKMMVEFFSAEIDTKV